MAKLKKCERCTEPLTKNVENLVTYRKSVRKNKFEDIIEMFDVKELCNDCFEIVVHAISPESCGDPVMRKKIQEIVKRNTLTPKS